MTRLKLLLLLAGLVGSGCIRAQEPELPPSQQAADERRAIDCTLERALRAMFEPPEGGAAVVNVPLNVLRE